MSEQKTTVKDTILKLNKKVNSLERTVKTQTGEIENLQKMVYNINNQMKKLDKNYEEQKSMTGYHSYGSSIGTPQINKGEIKVSDILNQANSVFSNN